MRYTFLTLDHALLSMTVQQNIIIGSQLTVQETVIVVYPAIGYINETSSDMTGGGTVGEQSVS